MTDIMLLETTLHYNPVPRIPSISIFTTTACPYQYRTPLTLFYKNHQPSLFLSLSHTSLPHLTSPPLSNIYLFLSLPLIYFSNFRIYPSISLSLSLSLSMDPTSIPPPPPPPPNTTTFPIPISVPTISAPVPFTLESNNHIPPAPFPVPVPATNAIPIPNPTAAAAAAPAPNHNHNHNHPPYAEMIYTAIGALKEKDGSSKRAIGKYIEQVYRDLPPTHSALLTHHLKRLKTNGHLVMVKKSYKLPLSPPLPRSDASVSVSVSPSAPTPVQTQRGRGRPPKPKPQPQAQLFSQQTQPQPLSLPFPQQPVPNLQQNAEPVWVALGLADEPAAVAPTTEVKKRGPGRPRKIGVVGVGPAVPVRRGRPPGTGRSRLPKRPGRPPKPKSVSAISNGLKRRPGRPPKLQSKPTVIPFAAPASAPAAILAPGVPTVTPTVLTASVPVGSPRPRGRPKKNAAAVPGVGAPALPVVGGAARGRGRGRGRGFLPMVRQGRPPKLAVVGRPKNPTGRPVGRPKGSTAATTAQKVVNEDLRRKLEYFQSKVKESLGVLKPYFNHESPVTAIAAIQELEILATLDLNAPLRDETQQLQQLPQQLSPQQQLPPQQLPQPQIYQQQYSQIPPQPQLQQLFQPHASAPS